MGQQKQNRILVAHNSNSEIAKVFGVTSAMVGKALHGKGNSELAKKIRHVALTQYDGHEVVFKNTISGEAEK